MRLKRRETFECRESLKQNTRRSLQADAFAVLAVTGRIEGLHARIVDGVEVQTVHGTYALGTTVNFLGIEGIHGRLYWRHTLKTPSPKPESNSSTKPSMAAPFGGHAQVTVTELFSAEHSWMGLEDVKEIAAIPSAKNCGASGAGKYGKMRVKPKICQDLTITKCNIH